jgi:NAD(P)-dependent dehydrogenase (short-subunit alcohol dehydrogenase family)
MAGSPPALPRGSTLSALTNKTFIISGGVSGIGAATARIAHGRGANVVLTDLNEDAGKAIARELGERVLFLRHDVTKEPEWISVVAETKKRFGRLDGILNSAGVGRVASMEDCTLEEFRLVNAVNATGTFLGCKHGVLAMKETGGGSLVNISSVLGLRGMNGAPAYCASKGSVRLLSKSVALHCAAMGYDIRCNSVHPGWIETPMVTPRIERSAAPAETRARMEKMHPLGRLGRPEEIGALCVFLLSDEASLLTGAEFVGDGGLTA